MGEPGSPGVPTVQTFNIHFSLLHSVRSLSKIRESHADSHLLTKFRSTRAGLVPHLLHASPRPPVLSPEFPSPHLATSLVRSQKLLPDKFSRHAFCLTVPKVHSWVYALNLLLHVYRFQLIGSVNRNRKAYNQNGSKSTSRKDPS